MASVRRFDGGCRNLSVDFLPVSSGFGSETTTHTIGLATICIVRFLIVISPLLTKTVRVFALPVVVVDMTEVGAERDCGRRRDGVPVFKPYFYPNLPPTLWHIRRNSPAKKATVTAFFKTAIWQPRTELYIWVPIRWRVPLYHCQNQTRREESRPICSCLIYH